MKRDRPLALLRKRAGLSQNEARRLLGCGRRTLQIWEHGSQAPAIGYFAALVRHYNASADEVLAAIEAGGALKDWRPRGGNHKTNGGSK